MMSEQQTGEEGKSVIRHPVGQPRILLAQWALDATGGDECAAVILGYFYLRQADEGLFAPPVTAADIQEGALLFGLTSIRAALPAMVTEGFLLEINYDDAAALSRLRAKKAQQIEAGGKRCAWCGGTTLILQQHHYPTTKRAGGAKTVNICGSCHAEWHYLRDNRFYFSSPQLRELFRVARKQMEVPA